MLKLIVDLGEEQRQVVAGIAQHYQPHELIGKRVLFVANLNLPSYGNCFEGMLLAASMMTKAI